MLVEFSAKNFRSIKDKVTLSLAASPDVTHLDNTFVEPSGKMRLLKTAAIYGANASGKSNIIRALEVMRGLVRNSHKQQRGDEIDVTPFRLDPVSAREPSEFEVVFVKDGIRYVYGFSADQTKVHEEWLRETDLGGERAASRRLFQRELQADGHYEWAFGERWKPKPRELENQTLENELYLSLAVKSNHKKASVVFDWFSDTLRSMSGKPEDSGELAFTMELCDDHPDLKQMVLQMVRDADLGIQDFISMSEPLHESRSWLALPDDVRNALLSRLKGEHESAVLKRVVTRHRLEDSSGLADFDLLDDESDGTKRFFSLAGPFVHSIVHGHIIFCDELDSSLHPMLSRALVDMVHHNSRESFQFIFTTHDCSLLDADLFRRDQVWFTEKDKRMATDLYSLWDIKPRIDDNFRKGYLNGRYGAIPFVGEFTF